MKQTICRWCNSQNSSDYLSIETIFKDKFKLRKCLGCSAYFLDPPPTEFQLKRAYSTTYYGEGNSKFNPFVESVVDYFRKAQGRKLTKRLPAHSRLLDVGCGNGNFLQFMLRLGNYKLYGIEPEGKAAQRAAEKEQINLKVGTLEKGDFPEEYFDLISFIHVFEHLPNPKESIEIVKSILKKDALLLLSFPNIASRQAKKYKSDWFHLDPPRHIYFFEPRKFIEEMQSLGFELLEEKYFSIQYNPFGYQQSLLNRMLKKREVLYESIKGNKEYTSDYPKWSIFLQKAFHYLSFPYFILLDYFDASLKKAASVELLFRKR